jgi:hypothetical protein
MRVMGLQFVQKAMRSPRDSQDYKNPFDVPSQFVLKR